ncbi:uroporphyrinogen-III C-methyltransferase [Pengzhenrongella frigida]|uniref:uroporphyrinogen-III C-methyltransferase n=1 Tax=Pengzhenrongella frigida TaxID=1259133 RepID=A0A4Q5MVM3_9MICO|nr:uroporphyrinogen-III C-methyltransferase [Cellulomonas sp. HLT2-17]RYV49656.1 uroporphyrinogen-III C-methyltransferase [Cellulomonas sp. HLT2-17]
MTALLGLDLTGRRVLVAGGGPVAARRVRALVLDGADVLVVAPQVCEEIAELVGDRSIAWRTAEVAEGDLDGAWLVHTATGDRATDAAVAAWAAARRTWCINAGEASVGSARTPAVARVGEVVLGVVSAGAPDPRRSRTVRDALAEHLRSGGADLRRRRPAAPGSGRVVLVGGGPGAVDLLTLRGRRALAEADVVVTDRLGPTAVLDELPGAVEVVDVGKTPGHHAVPQHEINRILVERALRGQVVVRLKGGDPFVFGRGGEEVLACHEAGVPVEVVPGVSSVVAAPAAVGIPLTHRGTTAAYHVLNGHGGLDAAARLILAEKSATLVILMGVAVLGELVADALAHGADPATPVAIIEDGTGAHERVTRAPLDAIVDRARLAGVRSPAVIVIGDVAAPGLLGGGHPTDPADATMSL